MHLSALLPAAFVSRGSFWTPRSLSYPQSGERLTLKVGMRTEPTAPE